MTLFTDPVLPTSCTVVGLPGWLLLIVSVPVVMPEAGAVKDTSAMHHGAVEAGIVAARLDPHGYVGSCVTVKPLLAEIVPRDAALLPVFMIAICWIGVAWPTVALSNVVVVG